MDLRLGSQPACLVACKKRKTALLCAPHEALPDGRHLLAGRRAPSTDPVGAAASVLQSSILPLNAKVNFLFLNFALVVKKHSVTLK